MYVCMHEGDFAMWVLSKVSETQVTFWDSVTGMYTLETLVK